MTWYLAKLVYRIVCGKGDHTAQFDEQLRLILATNREEALKKGIVIGQQEADEFYNQKQQLVCWRFINIAELYEMDELIDGAELYSSIREVEQADAYISFVNHKAACLEETRSSHYSI